MRQLHCLHPHQLLLLFIESIIVHVDVNHLVLENLLRVGKHGRLFQVVAHQLALDVPLLSAAESKLHRFRVAYGHFWILLGLRLVISSVRLDREVLL